VEEYREVLICTNEGRKLWWRWHLICLRTRSTHLCRCMHVLVNNLLDMIMWLIISEHFNYWNSFDKFDFFFKQKKTDTNKSLIFVYWSALWNPTYILHALHLCVFVGTPYAVSKVKLLEARNPPHSGIL
jgi:hypothetical protein